MENQKMDDFFKEKLQHRSFEMKDEYWKDAEILIEKERKRKRRWWGFIWSMLGISLIGLVLFLYFNTNPTVVAPAISSTQEGAASSQKENNSTTEVESIASATLNESNENSNALTSANETTVKNTGLKSESQISEANKTNQENQNTTNTKASNLKTQEQNGSVNPTNEALAKASETKNSTITTKQEDTPKSQTALQQNEQTAKILQNGNLSNTNLDKPKEAITVLKTDEESTKGKTTTLDGTSQSVQQLEIVKQESKEASSQKELLQNEESTDQNTTVVSTEKTLNRLDFLYLAHFPEALEGVDRLTLFPKDQVLEPFEGDASSSSFSGGRRWNLGFVFHAGWYPGKDSTAASTAYHFGLTGRFKINRNWMLSADVLLAKRSGNFDAGLAVDTIRQVSYGFGKKEDFYEVSGSSVFTIEVPLSLQFVVDKHVFETGLSLNYLLSSKANLTFNEYLQPWERNESGALYKQSVTEEIRLKESQFSTFYPAFHVGYQYRLLKRWQLGVRARLVPGGLNPEAASIGLRFGLRFYLF